MSEIERSSTRDQPDHRRDRRDRLPDQPAGPERRASKRPAPATPARGFAVVASEVRALAQRSAEAAKEIKSLICGLRPQVAEGVDLVGRDRRGAERASSPRGRDRRAGRRDRRLGRRSRPPASREVNTAVNQMDQVTQQNAAMVEEIHRRQPRRWPTRPASWLGLVGPLQGHRRRRCRRLRPHHAAPAHRAGGLRAPSSARTRPAAPRPWPARGPTTKRPWKNSKS